MMGFQVHAWFDPVTATVTYVLHEEEGGMCAIIDPVLDYDPSAGRTETASAERVMAFVREKGLRVQWLLETHAHADHLSAAPYLRRELGGSIAIGESILSVQGAFKDVFNLEPEFRLDGSQFDHLFAADEVFHVGGVRMRALHVPGHTPADMAYMVEAVGDAPAAVFVGDTLFMPDVGSARCDFPGGDARTLYRSVRTLLALPPETRLFMCHDYPPPGRTPQWETSVAAQRQRNIHLNYAIDEDTFVAMRQKRDATLTLPNLFLPAIQVNIRAGQMPPAERNGVSYLKIPLNLM